MQINYSDVIDADDYSQGLMKHLWIPQIDTITLEKIRERTITLLNGGLDTVRILDLGCGPGRLTEKIAKCVDNAKTQIIGIDKDDEFIKVAISNKQTLNSSYVLADLPHLDIQGDILLIYGVWHHLDKKERGLWREMIKKSLSPQGSLFVGDEFVTDYNNEYERINAAALLYMNVIADAFTISSEKIDELVRIEIMNMIEDFAASGYGKGVLLPQDFLLVARSCLDFKHQCEHQGYNNVSVAPLIQKITGYTEQASSAGIICNSRGDYKISIEKQQDELGEDFVLASKSFSGNENIYGGMGLLEFKFKNSL